jgi:hypothetical protein
MRRPKSISNTNMIFLCSTSKRTDISHLVPKPRPYCSASLLAPFSPECASSSRQTSPFNRLHGSYIFLQTPSATKNCSKWHLYQSPSSRAF